MQWRILTFIAIILSLRCEIEVDQNQPTCNIKLLKSYKLGGLKHPSPHRMHICPQVEVKCCTLVDEIAIHQLWKKFSSINASRFVNRVVRAWFKLMEYHDLMKKLDRDDIVVHYMSWRWVPTIWRMCDHRYLKSAESNSNHTPMTSELTIDSELPGIGRVQRFKFRYLPDYLDVIMKRAHMRHVIEIYKAVLNQIVLQLSTSNNKSLGKLKSVERNHYEAQMKLWHSKLAKNFLIRKQNKNKLYIPRPEELKHALLGGVKIPIQTIKVKVLGEQLKRLKKRFKKENGAVNKVLEILRQEGLITSMYNMSQITDLHRLRDYVYKFVLKYRHYNKSQRTMEWKDYRPTMFMANFPKLKKCPKYVLRLHKKVFRRMQYKKYLKKMRHFPRTKRRIVAKRMKILRRWKKRHEKFISRREKKKFRPFFKNIQRLKRIKRKRRRKKLRHRKMQKQKQDRAHAAKMASAKAAAANNSHRRRRRRRSWFGRRKKKRQSGQLTKAQKKQKNQQKKSNDALKAMDPEYQEKMRLKREREAKRRREAKASQMIPGKFKLGPYIKNKILKGQRNAKYKAILKFEKALLKKQNKKCNFKCQELRIPRGIDFNYMCLLPKPYWPKKYKFKYLHRSNRIKNSKNKRNARKRRKRNNRRRRRKSRRNRNKFRKLINKNNKAKLVIDSPKKATSNASEVVTATTDKPVIDSESDLKNETLGVVSTDSTKPLTKKPQFQIDAKAIPSPSTISERLLYLTPPKPKTEKADQSPKFTGKALKMLNNLYKKPVVKKNDRHNEHISKLRKIQENSLSAKDKLQTKVEKITESDFARQEPVKNREDFYSRRNLEDVAPTNEADEPSAVSLIQEKTKKTLDRQLFWWKKKKNKGKRGGSQKKQKSFLDIFKPPPKEKQKKFYETNLKDQFYVKPPKQPKTFIKSVKLSHLRTAVPALLNSRLKLTSFPRDFFYRTHKPALPLIGSFIARDEKVTCRTFKRHIWKSFAGVNKEKIRYCYRVFDSLKAFDTDHFRETIMVMRAKLTEMLKMKRGFYCSICDFEKQTLFDEQNKYIMYSGQFCVDILDRFKDLLYYQNVIMVEYMDQMLQLISCYRSNGNTFDFPFHTFLEMKKRRIFFVQRCLKHQGTVEGRLKNCMFICNTYQYIRFSKFFDGDLYTLNMVLMRIFQYLREMQISPYIKSPAFESVLPEKFPDVTVSSLESSVLYDNALDNFLKVQKNKGKVKLPSKTMNRDNAEQKLAKKLNKLQYKFMFKDAHFDESIDHKQFNKSLKKELKLDQIRASAPPDYIPTQLKMAWKKRARRRKANAKVMKMLAKRFGIKSNPKSIKRTEQEVKDQVKMSYIDEAKRAKHFTKKLVKLKEKLKRQKEQAKKENARRRRRKGRKMKLIKIPGIPDGQDILDISKTIKELKNDANYYGVKENDMSTDKKKLTESNTQIPIRILKSKKKIKKGKNIIILSQRVYSKKKKKFVKTKVPMKWSRFPFKKKKNKKGGKKKDRFAEQTKRQNSNWGYYPDDSQHIMHGIYTNKGMLIDLKEYHPIFMTEVRGLHPIKEAEMMNLNIDLEKMLEKEYDRRNPEQFNKLVIKRYFSIPNSTINTFNNDVQFNFKDFETIKNKPDPKKIPHKKYAKKRPGAFGVKKPPYLKAPGIHNKMMKKHHINTNHQRNPTEEEGDFGIHESDPQTSSDTSSKLMFYIFDHRSKYPIFKDPM